VSEFFAVVTLVLGGTLTLAGQWLADRRTNRREEFAAAQRRADMRAGELRQTLYEIQDQMAGLADTVAQLADADPAARSSLPADFSRSTHRIRLLLERVPEASIRVALHAYLEAKERERKATVEDRPGAQAAAAEVYDEGQDLIGVAIRTLDGYATASS
jgi:hypothetical protein